MKYFTLTAVKGNDPERGCALIDAPNIKDAAIRARRLRDAGFLSYVKQGSTYAIRPSSRRETDLLQKFLNACNRTETKIHLQSDFDGLLARRQSLLLSFFMGLYLAPDKLKRMANGGIDDAKDRPVASTPSGSGGVEQAASQEMSADEAEASPPAAEQDAVSNQSEAAVEQKSSGDDPIDNSNQDDMLASILNGSSDTNSGGDHAIDLGDDEVL
eukprot:GHVR01050475.1.p1 GENE.GHVR01050475.1~~GHVR01050475.1.p1  ORF type:complete len:214 (+),score=36.21 GHVR01050475.1:401-1042(+)